MQKDKGCKDKECCFEKNEEKKGCNHANDCDCDEKNKTEIPRSLPRYYLEDLN